MVGGAARARTLREIAASAWRFHWVILPSRSNPTNTDGMESMMLAR